MAVRQLLRSFGKRRACACIPLWVNAREPDSEWFFIVASPVAGLPDEPSA
jgi:hypothetical protein